MAQFSSSLYPQTNPTNPVLLELRQDLPLDRAEGISFTISVAKALETCHRSWWSCSEATDAHLDHARCVLERLAVLSG